jgi:hypothetical protein
MTTNDLIKRLKEADPDGNTTIAFLHRDEYLETEPLSIEKVDGKDFRNDYKDYLDVSPWSRKRKILLIVPFND